MDILDDMGVSKLSAEVFFFLKVNYSFNWKADNFSEPCSQLCTTMALDGVFLFVFLFSGHVWS